MINSVLLNNFVLALCHHVSRTYFFRCLSLPLMMQVDDLTAQVKSTPSTIDLPHPSSLPVMVSCSSLYITLLPHLWCCTIMWTMLYICNWFSFVVFFFEQPEVQLVRPTPVKRKFAEVNEVWHELCCRALVVQESPKLNFTQSFINPEKKNMQKKKKLWTH